MGGNRVVARYRNGRRIKGVTGDFGPTRDFFHVQPEDGGDPVTVWHADLKAVFFVRNFVGNRYHEARNEFDAGRLAIGKKIRVVFEDGEVLVGTTQGYHPGRPGFFVVPADPAVNTERCYVIVSATREVDLLQPRDLRTRGRREL